MAQAYLALDTALVNTGARTTAIPELGDAPAWTPDLQCALLLLPAIT
jgi:hypothetical protein